MSEGGVYAYFCTVLDRGGHFDIVSQSAAGSGRCKDHDLHGNQRSDHTYRVCIFVLLSVGLSRIMVCITADLVLRGNGWRGALSERYMEAQAGPDGDGAGHLNCGMKRPVGLRKY